MDHDAGTMWGSAPEGHQEILESWWSVCGDSSLRLAYPLTEDSLVLDLGGYEGEWAARIFERYKCRVIIFEPAQDFARRISRRFRNNPKVRVCSYGLGAESRRDTLYLCEDASSLHVKSSANEAISIVDVHSWFKNNLNGSVALMKVNIEGEEYPLLERMAETGLFSRVNHLQVQFHPMAEDSAERMSRIQQILSRTHRLSWQYRFVWESWEKDYLR